MTTYHPVFGELLNSRQASALTGHTMNQLRNFRQKPETSPFRFIKQGGTAFYRKDDIEAWAEANGSLTFDYVEVPGITGEPLRSIATDAKKSAQILELAKLTTKNVWGSHATWLIEKSGLQDVNRKVDAWAEEFWNLHREANPEAEEYVSLNFSRIDNPTQYWPAITWAVRRATAYVRGWDVTDREIMDIPIGDNPPGKIV
tara:strand:- start:45 stop:647 length:603 start_codon:yes stop_codon:yes gene_type:complete